MSDFGKPEIDAVLAEKLGQVVIHWSTIEYLISLTLGTFLHADLGGIQLITSGISTSIQSRWIQNLLQLHEHEAIHSERVSDLLKRADVLRSERNQFVHGSWDSTGCESASALVQTIGLDRKEIIRERLVTMQDLTDLLRDIDDWIDDFITLGRELGFPRHRGSSKSIFAD